jgi:hypothetical protein
MARADFGHLGRRLGQAGQLVGPRALQPWARSWPAIVGGFLFFQNHYLYKYFRNPFKLPKIIVTCRNLREIQINFF